ncbi:glycosyltransferase [Desulfurococcus mucosus]|uniref:Glycosyl transferase family 2 n=1 Tax=Desulfurococcus mucosus (strain ATCC 35584 / DSM 2162 / JCM 9187 / O7/1) TaxID=765177 RepID=E8R8A8_DESM0|nr:glycosyltransferase [Desulfurococcus mucosus]ADV64734.1 glycosyl transferase family 2 [Desulfurococcus mucosus DSM 2162]
MLEEAALTLALLHFGFPLYYYSWAKGMLGKSVRAGRDPGFTPRVAVVIPTYNEAGNIERKLEDIYSQDYPRDRITVYIVDSASSDGTVGKALDWASRHKDIEVRIVEEGERRGKGRALNTALNTIDGGFDFIVVTDADAFWANRDALRNALSYFSDESVGAVSCVKTPGGGGFTGVESGYRDFYNVVRLGESSAYSTPVFHGELSAYRRRLLEDLGGFPTDIGSDDSHTATLIAVKGYRAIVAPDVYCYEPVPRRKYFHWRVRRAQHLIQHFAKSIRLLPRSPKAFRKILAAEIFLHLANPILLLISIALLAYSAYKGSPLSLSLLALGTALLAYKPYRTWIVMQLILLVAMVKNAFRKELVWSKEEKE